MRPHWWMVAAALTVGVMLGRWGASQTLAVLFWACVVVAVVAGLVSSRRDWWRPRGEFAELDQLERARRALDRRN